MSQQSKTKRGESGSHNAETNAFRLNGGGCWPLHLRSIMRSIGYEGRIGRPAPGSAFDRGGGQ